MNPRDELDPRLARKFEMFDVVPERNPKKAANGRAAFLQEAQIMANGVTPQPKLRHKGWMQIIQSILIFRRKEHSPMFSTFTTVLLVISLLLGGGGVTVAAAQNSLPDQPLYAVKTMSENVRSELTTNPQSKFELALALENRRAEEVQTMLQADKVPAETVQTRYQNQVEQALRYALNLPTDQAVQALEQLRARLLEQQQAMLQVQANGSPEAEAALVRTRQMLQDRLQWVEQGLKDPDQLREQLRQRDQNQQRTSVPANPSSEEPGAGKGNPWTTETPVPGSGYGPGAGSGDGGTCTPSAGENNPWTTETPVPGSGYGPGTESGDDGTCTPSAGENNPWTTETPVPGSGYGPGSTNTPGEGTAPAEPQATQMQLNQPTPAGFGSTH